MSTAGLSPTTTALLDVMFGAGDREEARKLLEDQCGTNLPNLSELDPIQLERYRFAAIKISNGNLTALARAISLAKIDWRDLLMEADFGHNTRAHELWCADVLRASGRAP